MTVVWFVVWLIANNVGHHEPLLFNLANSRLTKPAIPARSHRAMGGTCLGSALPLGGIDVRSARRAQQCAATDGAGSAESRRVARQ
jgi:hypothetical protein